MSETCFYKLDLIHNKSNYQYVTDEELHVWINVISKLWLMGIVCPREFHKTTWYLPVLDTLFTKVQNSVLACN
jgi:hypothetical protein